MRNRSPRSFTVENKSGGRDQRTFIPHRATTPAIPRPALSWPPPAEPKVPAVEARRILPSLIEAEPMQVEPDPAQVQPVRERASDERSSKPRRGRPPKAKPVAAATVEEPIAGTTSKAAPAEPVSPPASRPPAAPLVRTAKPAATLPLGERWKRRLNRWAR
jgi:hypothetical protein